MAVTARDPAAETGYASHPPRMGFCFSTYTRS